MAEVSENLKVPREVNHGAIEIVEFTATGTNDFYYSRKFGIVDAAFATNLTADGKEIRVNKETQGNGRVKINIICESVPTTGYLTIIGRK